MYIINLQSKQKSCKTNNEQKMNKLTCYTPVKVNELWISASQVRLRKTMLSEYKIPRWLHKVGWGFLCSPELCVCLKIFTKSK